jgi:hypothetical protein
MGELFSVFALSCWPFPPEENDSVGVQIDGCLASWRPPFFFATKAWTYGGAVRHALINDVRVEQLGAAGSGEG